MKIRFLSLFFVSCFSVKQAMKKIIQVLNNIVPLSDQDCNSLNEILNTVYLDKGEYWIKADKKNHNGNLIDALNTFSTASYAPTVVNVNQTYESPTVPHGDASNIVNINQPSNLFNLNNVNENMSEINEEDVYNNFEDNDFEK